MLGLTCCSKVREQQLCVTLCGQRPSEAVKIPHSEILLCCLLIASFQWCCSSTYIYIPGGESAIPASTRNVGTSHVSITQATPLHTSICLMNQPSLSLPGMLALATSVLPRPHLYIHLYVWWWISHPCLYRNVGSSHVSTTQAKPLHTSICLMNQPSLSLPGMLALATSVLPRPHLYIHLYVWWISHPCLYQERWQ